MWTKSLLYEDIKGYNANHEFENAGLFKISDQWCILRWKDITQSIYSECFNPNKSKKDILFNITVWLYQK